MRNPHEPAPEYDAQAHHLNQATVVPFPEQHEAIAIRAAKAVRDLTAEPTKATKKRKTKKRKAAKKTAPKKPAPVQLEMPEVPPADPTPEA